MYKERMFREMRDMTKEVAWIDLTFKVRALLDLCEMFPRELGKYTQEITEVNELRNHCVLAVQDIRQNTDLDSTEEDGRAIVPVVDSLKFLGMLQKFVKDDSFWNILSAICEKDKHAEEILRSSSIMDDFAQAVSSTRQELEKACGELATLQPTIGEA